MNLLELDGQKNTLDHVTHLHWKIHSYEATLEERGRYVESWHISLNKEGTQGPIGQRPDFREAKHTYLQLYKEHVESTSEGIVQSILKIKQDIIVNNLKVSRSTTAQLIPEPDGDYTLQPDQQARLYPRAGSRMTIGSRIKVGILGDL